VKPGRCRARVIAVRRLAPEILEADLRMEEPATLAFEAGQWVSIPFGPKIVRAYSIASTPASPSVITLCADVAPGGIGSAWFRGLAPGAPVDFQGPLGGFLFSRADARRPLFVAEEIGVVPIRSIVTALYATAFDRPTALVHWGREPHWLAYHEEFGSLARQCPGFTYRPVVARAPDGWTGSRGSLIDTVAEVAPPIGGLVVYVAGGERTIHGVRDLLTSRGLDRKAVKWEKFW
jgi:CDP-4-dehydro-6-deoxyglucose reductase, E3